MTLSYKPLIADLALPLFSSPTLHLPTLQFIQLNFRFSHLFSRFFATPYYKDFVLRKFEYQ
mgnify:CR=1 FL=1